MNNNKNRKGTGQYIPNFNDPRIRKRVTKALGWAAGCVRSEPREMAKNWIDTHLGQQQNELGRWLRDKLLVCRDNTYFFGDDGSKCKEYSLNQAGWDEVNAMLAGTQNANAAAPMQAEGKGKSLQDMELVHAWVREDYKDELASKDFQYTEKNSARLWHPLQNLTRTAKAFVWQREGLGFNYDIQACAPTLIMQHAQHLGFDEWLYGMDDFLSDPTAFRKHVAEVVGYDYNDEQQAKKVKALVTAMFCGANLSANRDSAIFHLLDQSYKRVRALQNDARLMLLKDDIKRCWQAIEPDIGIRRNAETGRKIRLGSTRKWNRYFDLERLVLNSVRAYLTKQGLKFFLEHDGWRTDQAIDVEALQAYVFHSTGYRIKITFTSSEASSESLHEDFDESLPDDTESIAGDQPEQQQVETQEKITRCSNYPIVLKVNDAQRACEIAKNPNSLARLREQLLTRNDRPNT